jgi:5-methylcytosine-specific restriction protein A
MPVRPPTFRPKGARTRRQAQAEHDARRGSARERGYTHRWDEQALAYRRQYPLCAGCEAIGKVVAAEVVDHIVPHKGDATLMWDRANWQSACGWHHDVVKQRLEHMHAQGLIDASSLDLKSKKAIDLSNELRPAGGAV